MGDSSVSATGHTDQAAATQDAEHSPSGQGRTKLPGEEESERAANGETRNTNFIEEPKLNKEGKYIEKLGEGHYEMDISTNDRLPGSWNGNRAEVRSEKSHPTTQANDFEGWYHVREGKGFSTMQLFHYAENEDGEYEGYPEVMVEVDQHGELKVSGRGVENRTFGRVPEDGRFGIHVDYDGQGNFTVRLFHGTRENPTPLEPPVTGELQRNDGNLHFRTGVYFNGHNHKSFADGYEMYVSEELEASTQNIPVKG